MKKCIIINCYNKNSVDEALTNLCIENFKSRGYDILLVSSKPVSTATQESVKYFLYIDEDETLTETINTAHYYHITNNHEIRTNFSNTFGDHSFNILKKLSDSLSLLERRGYDFFIYSDFDCIFDDEQFEILENNESDVNLFNYDGNDPNVFPICSMFFSGKISSFKIIDEYTEKDKYIKFCEELGISSTLECVLPALVGFSIIDFPFYSHEWMGVSMGGRVHLPILPKKNNSIIDIMRDLDNNDTIWFFRSPNSVEGSVKLYADTELITEMFPEGINIPFIYEYKNHDKKNLFRFESYINGNLDDSVEKNIQDILDNETSYLKYTP